MLNDTEISYLERCIELAGEALDAGDEPFGSVLVDADGQVRAEDRNRIAGGDATQHPEFALARWAAEHMTPDERLKATVYTSGEHCVMCAAAHGWVGLGRIVYASSTAQLTQWLSDFGAPPMPIKALPIQDIAPDVIVEGPVDGLDAQVRALHAKRHSQA